MLDHEITIGDLSARTGVAPSALRYYEEQSLIHSYRTTGNQRRYHREVVRRVSFVRAAQQLGLTLEEIHAALDSLPDRRTPTDDDWSRIAASWRPRIDAQIRMLERLKDRLDGCIGCGCLSLKVCRLVNPGDCAAERGTGPRYIIDEDDPGDRDGPPGD